MAIKGNAAIRWTPPGGTETTHTLAYPLTLEPVGRVRTRSWNSFPRDKSARAAFAVEGRAWEYRTTLRFDTEPAELLDILEDGADGVQIDYYPDNSASTHFDAWIVDVGERVEISGEEERARKEYRVEVTLREIDSDWSGILTNASHD